MKRPKLKIFNHTVENADIAQQVSPWNKDNELDQQDQLEQIPTYRRQIVNKFLSNLHSKNKKLTQTLQHSLPHHRNYDGSGQKFLGRSQKIGERSSNKTEGRDREQEYQLLRIFKDDLYKKRKSRLKTTVINFNAEWDRQVKNTKQKFIKQQEENSKSFTRKLRLKQQIANKKNIERYIDKKKSATMTNIFKNPFYLYEFGNVQSSYNKNSLLFPSATYQPSGSLKKRPTSEAGLRLKNPYTLY